MIDQQREMLQPGEGIVRDPGPNKTFEEYPRYMSHPGYQRGRPAKETKVLDEHGNPTGRVVYLGGQSIKFPPMLVRSPTQRDEHLSYGYVDNGKMDPSAFNRLVADVEPVPTDYKPLEFPKWCFGRVVNSPAEEEERLIELNVNQDGSPRTANAEPALDTEVNTLETWPIVTPPSAPPAQDEDDIEALEAKLAVLKAKKARAAALKAEIAQLEAEEAPEPEPPPTMEEYFAAKELAKAAEAATPAAVAMRAARAVKMREGKARKKAEREAAASAQEEDKAA